MADKAVTKENNFSKFVLANKLAIVFKIKITKKTHKMMFTDVFPMKYPMISPLCNTKKMKKEFIRIESPSNTYISSTVLSLPPHVISNGIILIKINK